MVQGFVLGHPNGFYRVSGALGLAWKVGTLAWELEGRRSRRAAQRPVPTSGRVEDLEPWLRSTAKSTQSAQLERLHKEVHWYISDQIGESSMTLWSSQIQDFDAAHHKKKT